MLGIILFILNSCMRYFSITSNGIKPNNKVIVAGISFTGKRLDFYLFAKRTTSGKDPGLSEAFGVLICI